MKLNRYLFAVTFIFISIQYLNAQPNVLWEKTYGNSDEDKAYAVEQTSDGGFIITGYTFIPGFGQYLYVLKTDGSGDTLWTKTYAASGQVTGGEAVHETSDSNFIIAANIVGQFTLLKINQAGDTLWTKSYSTIFDGIRCNDMIITNDWGYLIVGYKSFPNMLQNIFLIKVDGAGDILWTKNYGGNFTDIGNAVQQTTDGGYIVCGNLQVSGSGNEIWLLKTDQFGDTVWTKTFGTSLNEFGYDVKQTGDGGYIISGTIENISKLWLIKTDSNGNTLWTKIFNTQIAANRYPKQGNSIIQTTDGGYMVAGFSGVNNSAGAEDAYLIKTDSTGDTLWTKTFGGLNVPDRANAIMQIDDSGFIVAGFLTDLNRSNVWIARIAPDAIPVELISFTSSVSGDAIILKWSTATEVNNSGFEIQKKSSEESFKKIAFVDGKINSTTINNYSYSDKNTAPGEYQYRLKQVDLNGTFEYSEIVNAVVEAPEKFELDQNYPNPFNPATNIEFRISEFGLVQLKIYDALGNEVAALVNEEKYPGGYKVEFNAASGSHRISSGIYFYQLKSGGFSQTQKMILMK